MTSDALERVIKRAGSRRAETAEHCDLCSVGVPDQHRHLLDTAREEVMCVCQACSLLFDQEAASAGHYKLMPRRRTRLGEVSTKALGVPVGLAFFVPREDDMVIAHYPSPMGATQWEVDDDAWREVTNRHPELRDLEADVEALLVNTTQGRKQHWIVPVDDCFRLVAVIRREWKGLSGGSQVWPAVDQFFADLTEQR